MPLLKRWFVIGLLQDLYWLWDYRVCMSLYWMVDGCDWLLLGALGSYRWYQELRVYRLLGCWRRCCFHPVGQIANTVRQPHWRKHSWWRQPASRLYMWYVHGDVWIWIWQFPQKSGRFTVFIWICFMARAIRVLAIPISWVRTVNVYDWICSCIVWWKNASRWFNGLSLSTANNSFFFTLWNLLAGSGFGFVQIWCTNSSESSGYICT